MYIYIFKRTEKKNKNRIYNNNFKKRNLTRYEANRRKKKRNKEKLKNIELFF